MVDKIYFLTLQSVHCTTVNSPFTVIMWLKNCVLYVPVNALSPSIYFSYHNVIDGFVML